MTTNIGNPLTWGVRATRTAGRHMGAMAGRIGSGRALDAEMPEVRRIDIADLRLALRKGVDDFAACRSDVIFLCLLYPLIGITLTWIGLQRDLIPLVFPVMAGFTLVGPAAAVGLYELSRRREQGLTTNWLEAFEVIKLPSFGAIVALSLVLLAIFGVWLLAAQGIYAATVGPSAPATFSGFLQDVLATSAGWAMIVLGMGTGFLFALLVLAISVVSFPLLLDRDVGVPVAVITSIRVITLNPVPIAVWGLIVAVALAIASIPVFAGLIIVLPVLGHATWHLYRRAVV